LGIAAIGFLENYYWLMFAAAVICGIGIAAFHPEGARMTNKIAGKKKASGMSFFTVGGNIGIALGPLIATPALLYFGLRGTSVFALTSIIVCVIIIFQYQSMRSDVKKAETEDLLSNSNKNEWLKFLWLSIAIISRSTISHSLNIFLPMYWMSVLEQSKAASGMVITFMVTIGGITTIIGGQLADRFGLNKIIRIGWLLLIPSIFFLTRITNPAFAFMILVPIAIGSHLAFTPMVVLGQKYLSKNVGFSSGVTLGLGISIGGVLAPILGRYADIHGLIMTLRLLSVLPVIGAIVAFTSRPSKNS
jgi:FSR family fosmidomycin resistance protein-like MFS transporter